MPEMLAEIVREQDLGRTQVPLPEEKIVAWPFEVARTRFLERYRELGGVLPAPPWEGVP